jgi:hypothetical protein
MKKALLDNEDILDGIEFHEKKCSDRSLLAERCNNIVILPAVSNLTTTTATTTKETR